jgi:hypothetical protein
MRAIVAAVLLLALGGAGAAWAQVPTKKIRIFNNSPVTLYVIIESESQGSPSDSKSAFGLQVRRG